MWPSLLSYLTSPTILLIISFKENIKLSTTQKVKGNPSIYNNCEVWKKTIGKQYITPFILYNLFQIQDISLIYLQQEWFCHINSFWILIRIYSCHRNMCCQYGQKTISQHRNKSSIFFTNKISNQQFPPNSVVCNKHMHSLFFNVTRKSYFMLPIALYQKKKLL